MEGKTYTIQELADEVNKRLGFSDNIDGRYAPLTERRIRDYATKKMLSKPLKDGRVNLYTEQHLQQLLVIRDLQQNAGMSEKTIMKAVSETVSDEGVSSNVEKDLKAEAQNLFASWDNKQVQASSAIDNYDLYATLGRVSGAIQQSEFPIEGKLVSKSVLRNLGEQYISSSSLNNVAENNSGLSDLSDLVKFNNESEQENKLSFKTVKNTKIIPCDGVEVIIDDSFNLTKENEEKIKLFFEELIRAYKK